MNMAKATAAKREERPALVELAPFGRPVPVGWDPVPVPLPLPVPLPPPFPLPPPLPPPFPPPYGPPVGVLPPALEVLEPESDPDSPTAPRLPPKTPCCGDVFDEAAFASAP